MQKIDRARGYDAMLIETRGKGRTLLCTGGANTEIARGRTAESPKIISRY